MIVHFIELGACHVAPSTPCALASCHLQLRVCLRISSHGVHGGHLGSCRHAEGCLPRGRPCRRRVAIRSTHQAHLSRLGNGRRGSRLRSRSHSPVHRRTNCFPLRGPRLRENFQGP